MAFDLLKWDARCNANRRHRLLVARGQHLDAVARLKLPPATQAKYVRAVALAFLAAESRQEFRNFVKRESIRIL